MPDHAEHEAQEAHDGCLCGLDHADHEATPDQDLPAATGGVEGKPRRRATRTAVEGEA